MLQHLKHLDAAFDVYGSIKKAVGRGAGLMAGADEVARATGGSKWTWGGGIFDYRDGLPMPKKPTWMEFRGLMDNPITSGVLTTVGVGFTGLGIAEGYSRDGVSGVVENLGMELAASTGVAATAYQVSRAGNVAIKSAGIARVIGGLGGGIMVGGMIGGPVGMAVAGGIGALGGTAVGAGMTIGLGGLALGGIASYGAYSAVKAAARPGYQFHQNRKNIQTSGSLAAFHTRGAHTMRSRAVQAISKSHLNARSALGQEANYMHFPSRSYVSRYRRI